MGVVAFVPVRGGSKSIPLKNIKDFAGKPLVYWVLKAIQGSSHIDLGVVSTDSDQIADIVKSFNFCKINIHRRSAVNAEDTSTSESAILEYINESNLDGEMDFFLIQATSPFTTSEQLDEGFEAYKSEKYDSLLSGVISKRFFWDWNSCPINYDYMNRPRRQDYEGLFMENGAFYISKVESIKKYNNRLNGRICQYVMPESSGVDIDEPHDWIMAEILFKKYNLIS